MVMLGFCTKYGNLYKEYRGLDFANDLGFSLYTMSFVCYEVTTSKGRTEFKEWVLIRSMSL